METSLDGAEGDERHHETQSAVAGEELETNEGGVESTIVRGAYLRLSKMTGHSSRT